VQAVDLLFALGVALVTALLAVMAVEVGTVFQNRIPRQLLRLLLAAAIVAAAAVVTRALTDQPVDVVLFSGQEATSQVLEITSVGALLIIAVAKTIGYAVSLGGGFRGGLVFPSVFLGVVVATATAQWLDAASLSAMVAAGIAAAVAGVLRLPFTGVLLALLLCAGAGLAVTTPAIIGAVVGVLVRAGADARIGRTQSPQPSAV
jgi:H+/Cl- antiporter ClcA